MAMPPPEFEKREPGRRFGLDRDRPAASAAHDRFDRSRGADGLCRRERRVHSMIARRARRIGAASRASAARPLKERIGAAQRPRHPGLQSASARSFRGAANRRWSRFGSKHPGHKHNAEMNELDRKLTRVHAPRRKSGLIRERLGCQLRNKKWGGVLSLRRLASGREVLRTTVMVLGLDPRMLAGHKRCAHVAAGLRRRPAGVARRGKHRERGRGKARLQGGRRERRRDLDARPHRCSIFGGLPGLTRGNLPK